MLKWSFSLFFLLFSMLFGDQGYVIKNYNVDVLISEKNDYKITEEIEVDFLEPRRGIYRIIPEKFNGKTIEVSDVRTNVETYMKDEGDYLYLRFGNPNKYLTGIKIYKLMYNYNIGWDRIKNYDEVYYNLIGNDWDTTIENLEFSITLPKKFDPSKLNFTVGKYGSVDKANLTWKVTGNTITGKILKPLAPKEAVTIALVLPEGYFDTTSEKYKVYIARTILNVILFLIPLIVYFIRNKYIKDQSVVETVEFYPPEGMTPTELGYYIDGIVNNKDMTSLIFYWANKGYLKIIEHKEKNLFVKTDYEIVRLVDRIESKKDYEVYLFNALFAYSIAGSIKVSILKNRFYKHIEQAKEIFYTDLVLENKELYTAKSMRISNLIRSFPLLIIASIIFYFVYTNETNIYVIGIEIILGMLAIIIILSLASSVKERTEFAQNILGRILGFKRFLITAEKSKLEMLLEENPEYFYNILPYTIVLNVSNKWAEKFGDLAVKPPEWYSTTGSMDLFTLGLFMGSFDRALNSLNDNMLSSPKAPSNFGGGMSSGSGGSAGGGAGGGGGGSW